MKRMTCDGPWRARGPARSCRNGLFSRQVHADVSVVAHREERSREPRQFRTGPPRRSGSLAVWRNGARPLFRQLPAHRPVFGRPPTWRANAVVPSERGRVSRIPSPERVGCFGEGLSRPVKRRGLLFLGWRPMETERKKRYPSRAARLRDGRYRWRGCAQVGPRLRERPRARPKSARRGERSF